jgi:hypothetical protein
LGVGGVGGRQVMSGACRVPPNRPPSPALAAPGGSKRVAPLAPCGASRLAGGTGLGLSRLLSRAHGRSLALPLRLRLRPQSLGSTAHCADAGAGQARSQPSCAQGAGSEAALTYTEANHERILHRDHRPLASPRSCSIQGLL